VFREKKDCEIDPYVLARTAAAGGGRPGSGGNSGAAGASAKMEEHAETLKSYVYPLCLR
jgi:hypothetical protein